MTGFGRATRESALWQITAEVKSVNHRFLKTQIKLPPLVESVEQEIENRVRAKVVRGAVNVFIDLKLRETPGPQQLEPATVRAHLDRLTSLWTAVFPDASMPEPTRLFEMIMRLPLPPANAAGTVSTELEQDVLGALDEALRAHEANREAEGAETGQALAEHRAHVGRMRERILAKAPVAIRAAQAKFVERVNQLLNEARPGLALDAEAVLKESALYAERGDIAEELNRLQGHLTRFDEVLAAPSEVGRRLDFLLQEMLREVNTMGSKSLDLGISHDVVEVKAEIEKMKEQVQNLE
jgi:uncharacterized protein (TIGR00255 family)